MKVEILGPGCPKCQALAANAKTAVQQLGLDCDIVKITEIDEIIRRGVMMTPALVVDGTVRTVGRATGVEEIKSVLSTAR